MTTMRVASAPVSFGVDEVLQDDAWMPDPDDMLDWMVDIGFEGTELGSPGYLGDGPTVHDRLSTRGLGLVGAFLPQHFSRPEKVEADAAWLGAALQLLTEASPEGSRPFAVLSDHRAAETCRAAGFEPVLHPHAGTYIETADEIDRVMNAMDASIVGLCLDTGHFRFGGADPAQAARDYRSVIRHVHIKDCRTAIMDGVRAEGKGLEEALARGVFCPLGEGDSGIDAVIAQLVQDGYAGWLVVEQDQFLKTSDTPASVKAGQAANRAYLRALGF
jgi:inosose dehydratase